MRYDLAVIGSGAGGGAAAYEATRRGLKVVILEAGPRFSPEDYGLEKESWELSGFPLSEASQSSHSFGKGQVLPRGIEKYASWDSVKGLLNGRSSRGMAKLHHVQGYGGSTLRYTGEAHRLNQDAFQSEQLKQKGVAWPFSYHDLDPFYYQAESLIGVAGPDDQSFRPRKQKFPYKPHRASYASELLRKGFKKKGLSWESNSLAVLPEARAERLACNYCGQCNRGCPRKDKGSVDVTFLKQAEDSGNLTVMTEVHVTQIKQGADDKIDSLEFINKKGEMKRVFADRFVVAAGVVETPRLLLLSKSKYSPDGLANESGLVGRNFMETLSWTSTALYPEVIGSHRGLPVDHVCWDFNAHNALKFTVGGCRFSPGTLEAGFGGPINYAQRIVPGWGTVHKKQMRKKFGSAIAVSGFSSQLPNEFAKVDLDPTKFDKSGLSVARINSYLEKEDFQKLMFLADTCRDLLQNAGCGNPVEEYGSVDVFNVAQAFGTCKAGSSPLDAVVDGFGSSFRWKNLSIMDASVFPWGGSGESPSLTIQAFALRGVASWFS